MLTIRRFPGPLAALCLLAISVVPVAAQSADPSPDPAPASAWVTGSLIPASDCTDVPTTYEPGVERSRFRCTGQTVTTSDPRLSGASTVEFSEDIHREAGDSFVVAVGRYDLQNDGGTWVCRYTSVVDDPEAMGSDAQTNLCVGSGAYEGLSAILVFDWTTCQPAFTQCPDSPVQVKGAIFSGEPPPSP